MDIRVYDEEDNLIARTEGEEAFNYGIGDITVFTEGDAKYISSVEGAKYRIEFTGTGEGVMSYRVSAWDTGKEEEISSKTFENVALTEDKTFVSEHLTEEYTEDTKLFVTEDEKVTGTVNADGEEEAADFGDILLQDIPQDGKIPAGVWAAGISDAFYCGSAVTEDLRLYYGTKLLKESEDYTLRYKNNKTPGDAIITASLKKNLSGSKEFDFGIKALPLEKVIALPVYADYKKGKSYKNLTPELYYNGQRLKYGKTDLAITYPSVSEEEGETAYETPGVYTIHIAAGQSGKFSGECDTKLIITEDLPLINAAAVKIDKSSLTYTGEEVLPSLTVNLKGKPLSAGTDYSVEYLDEHTGIGSHFAVLTGMGNYSGAKTISFKITGKYDLSNQEYASVRANPQDIVPDAESGVAEGTGIFTYYSAGGAKPEPIVCYKGIELRKNKDYSLSYQGNTALGSAKAIIKGKGQYSGTLEMGFQVIARDINSLRLNIALVYGKDSSTVQKTLKFTDEKNKDLKLREGTDYEIEIVEGESEEQALVNVTGKGNYSGTIRESASIVSAGKSLEKAKVTLNKTAFSYTGSPIELSASDIKEVKLGGATLSLETDYVITGCFNNIDKGTGYLKLTGTGAYGGYKIVPFKISAANNSAK